MCPRTTALDVQTAPISRGSRCLFLLIAAYLVIPILEAPLWGLSLSTPVFCFVTLDLLAGYSTNEWSRFGKWILFAVFFWIGLFLSLAGNVFLGNITDFSGQDVIWLTRFGYWITVFLVTTVLVSRMHLGERICEVLGFSVIALALLRLTEAVFLGAWGPGKAVLITPNSYGWLFSTFTPFAVWLALTQKGWKRATAVLGLFVLAVAVISNGSRSSWIAVGAGLVLIASLLVFLPRVSLSWLLLPLVAVGILSAAALSAMPSALWKPVQERISTFQRLDKDKPYLVRLLLIQKGKELFVQNPLFGAGVGKFQQTSVPLDIPASLRHFPQRHYDRKSAHNAYVAHLAETGLFGTGPFLILLLILTVSGFKAAVRRSRRGELWAIAVYVSFISMSLHLWTLSGLTGTSTWFVYGLVATLIQRESESPGAPGGPRPDRIPGLAPVEIQQTESTSAKQARME